MAKTIYKYATGQDVPNDAKYLCTVKQTKADDGKPCWFVWHYFLVEYYDKSLAMRLCSCKVPCLCDAPVEIERPAPMLKGV